MNSIYTFPSRQFWLALEKYIATYDLVDFHFDYHTLHRILHLSQCCHHLHGIGLASCLLDLGVLCVSMSNGEDKGKG